MELTNEFRVAVPIDQAWAVLTDVERIAPCMPGAELQEIEGEEYRGAVKVKVGPITAQYKGKATFQEKDDSGHKAVLKAEGRETRGQGNASAIITAQLAEDGDGTKVVVTTDLTISGKVAQFGRGVLADVSAKLLQQFVDCLESDVLAGGASPPPPAAETTTEEITASAPSTPAATASPAATPTPSSDGESSGSGGVRRIQSTPAAPVDLLDTAGAPVAKRAAPFVAVLFVVYWLLRRRSKAKKKRG